MRVFFTYFSSFDDFALKITKNKVNIHLFHTRRDENKVNYTQAINFINLFHTRWDENKVDYIQAINFKNLFHTRRDENKANYIQAINFINLFHTKRDKWYSKNESESRKTG